MKNPNSPWNKLKAWLAARWVAPDVPGLEPRFQLANFGRDLATFVVLPIAAILVSKMGGGKEIQERRRGNDSKRPVAQDSVGSQVIEFSKSRVGASPSVAGKRAPGTLVKLRLLNQVEAYSSIPVHAQIVDAGLGQRFLGGTLIGDGMGDAGFQRINITFRVARDPSNVAIAFPVAARALSLDGTLGVAAIKKEGFFARSAFSGAVGGKENAQTELDSMDLKSIVIKALSAGLLQEFGSGAQVERNRSQVLTLQAGTEFFAELTDYFPGGK